MKVERQGNYSRDPALEGKGTARPWNTPLRAQQLSISLPLEEEKNAASSRRLSLRRTRFRRSSLPKSFPRLAGLLAEILKSGNMTKRVAAATVNCMRWRRLITNRPGVAGAVLQTPLLLNYLATKSSVVIISSKYNHSQTERARDLKFWDNVHHPMCVRWQVSVIMCY